MTKMIKAVRAAGDGRRVLNKVNNDNGYGGSNNNWSYIQNDGT